MNLTITGHDDRYAVEQLQLALFPEDPEGEARCSLHRGKTWLTAVTSITLDGRSTTGIRRLKAAEETVRLRRRILQQSYYLAARQLLSEAPAWGALAGVRPTKITTKHLLEGGTPKSAEKLLRSVYYVTDDRAKLAVDCSVSTAKAVGLLDEKDVSLYVGIPFCPTRCAYCSFVSRTVGRQTGRMEEFLTGLEREIELTGQLLAQSGRRVRSLYIGGGTPTTLTAHQLAGLLEKLHASFDLNRCLELTVEAGRPDTVDEEKFRAIRDGGADRISINPQTMVDSVLRACGRPHTGDDILRAYEQASRVGFKAINMDLIAGLPTDTFEGFRHSLDTVAALKPANITVHTLALKKGADLFQRREQLPPQQAVEEMVAYSQQTLRREGLRPYYLYRQKYMSGSFENVGWSREGLDCLYNIYMMEESHSIISMGGGAMSKINLPGGKISRFPNPKFPEQYIEMIDSVLQQKQELAQML